MDLPEVEKIVPDYLRRLLFDEIVFLEQARRELSLLEMFSFR